MMQRCDLCSQHTTAKLMLLYEEDGEQRTVFAFAYGKTVHQSAGGDDVSVEVLIESGTDFLPYWLHCGHTLHGGIVIYCQWQLTKFRTVFPLTIIRSATKNEPN